MSLERQEQLLEAQEMSAKARAMDFLAKAQKAKANGNMQRFHNMMEKHETWKKKAAILDAKGDAIDDAQKAMAQMQLAKAVGGVKGAILGIDAKADAIEAKEKQLKAEAAELRLKAEKARGNGNMKRFQNLTNQANELMAKAAQLDRAENALHAKAEALKRKAQAAAQGGLPNPGPWLLFPQHSENKALHVHPERTNNLYQDPIRRGPRQHFVFERQGDGTFYIANPKTGRVVDVGGAKRAPGSEVITWEKNGQDNQKWSLEPAGGPRTFFIRGKQSGLYLTVNRAAQGEGPENNLVIRQKHGGKQQQFRFEKP